MHNLLFVLNRLTIAILERIWFVLTRIRTIRTDAVFKYK
jgi:hypothetical protein